jgi:ribosomal protein S16
MENTFRRDGRPIDEVGYYNPITKQYKFDTEKIKKWLGYGVNQQKQFSFIKKSRNYSIVYENNFLIS